MKVFIDTNIIIDLLGNRGEFTVLAKRIFKQSSNKEIVLFTSSHAIATAYYILRKYSDEAELRNTLYGLMNRVKVLSVDTIVLSEALMAVEFADFEDGIQHYTALKESSIDYIISRDKKGFKNSKIAVLDSIEFLNMFI
jgi:predicted nucleic acid-binding protein